MPTSHVPKPKVPSVSTPKPPVVNPPGVPGVPKAKYTPKMKKAALKALWENFEKEGEAMDAPEIMWSAFEDELEKNADAVRALIDKIAAGPNTMKPLQTGTTTIKSPKPKLFKPQSAGARTARNVVGGMPKSTFPSLSQPKQRTFKPQSAGAQAARNMVGGMPKSTLPSLSKPKPRTFNPQSAGAQAARNMVGNFQSNFSFRKK